MTTNASKLGALARSLTDNGVLPVPTATVVGAVRAGANITIDPVTGVIASTGGGTGGVTSVTSTTGTIDVSSPTGVVNVGVNTASELTRVDTEMLARVGLDIPRRTSSTPFIPAVADLIATQGVFSGYYLQSRAATGDDELTFAYAGLGSAANLQAINSILAANDRTIGYSADGYTYTWQLNNATVELSPSSTSTLIIRGNYPAASETALFPFRTGPASGATVTNFYIDSLTRTAGQVLPFDTHIGTLYVGTNPTRFAFTPTARQGIAEQFVAGTAVTLTRDANSRTTINAIIPPVVPTTNTLTNPTNTITSTVDGVAATAPAVNTVVNSITSGVLTTTVNGVAGMVTLPAQVAGVTSLNSLTGAVTLTSSDATIAIATSGQTVDLKTNPTQVAGVSTGTNNGPYVQANITEWNGSSSAVTNAWEGEVQVGAGTGFSTNTDVISDPTTSGLAATRGWTFNGTPVSNVTAEMGAQRQNTRVRVTGNFNTSPSLDQLLFDPLFIKYGSDYNTTNGLFPGFDNNTVAFATMTPVVTGTKSMRWCANLGFTPTFTSATILGNVQFDGTNKFVTVNFASAHGGVAMQQITMPITIDAFDVPNSNYAGSEFTINSASTNSFNVLLPAGATTGNSVRLNSGNTNYPSPGVIFVWTTGIPPLNTNFGTGGFLEFRETPNTWHIDSATYNPNGFTTPLSTDGSYCFSKQLTVPDVMTIVSVEYRHYSNAVDSWYAPASLTNWDNRITVNYGGALSLPAFRSLTTNGTSGAATLTTGVLNIPVYGGGTVTSVSGTASTVLVTPSSPNPVVSLIAGHAEFVQPYTTKTRNNVLAGPTTGVAALPVFRALDKLDIPPVTNLAGTVLGAIPYQSATDTTLFSAQGTAGQVLLSGGAGSPTWTNTVAQATTAFNNANGSISQMLYQTAANTSAFTNTPTTGQVLTAVGINATPTWAAASGGTPSATTPVADGIGAVGVATTYARGDHVHPFSITTNAGTTNYNNSTGVLNIVPGGGTAVTYTGNGLPLGSPATLVISLIGAANRPATAGDMTFAIPNSTFSATVAYSTSVFKTAFACLTDMTTPAGWTKGTVTGGVGSTTVCTVTYTATTNGPKFTGTVATTQTVSPTGNFFSSGSASGNNFTVAPTDGTAGTPSVTPTSIVLGDNTSGAWNSGTSALTLSATAVPFSGNVASFATLTFSLIGRSRTTGGAIGFSPVNVPSFVTLNGLTVGTSQNAWEVLNNMLAPQGWAKGAISPATNPGNSTTTCTVTFTSTTTGSRFTGAVATTQTLAGAGGDFFTSGGTTAGDTYGLVSVDGATITASPASIVIGNGIAGTLNSVTNALTLSDSSTNWADVMTIPIGGTVIGTRTAAGQINPGGTFPGTLSVFPVAGATGVTSISGTWRNLGSLGSGSTTALWVRIA